MAATRQRAHAARYVMERTAPGREGPLRQASRRFAATCVDPLRYHVSIADVAVFFRVLRLTTRSRLTLHQALMLLERSSRSRNLQAMLRACHEHVARGGRLSDALALYPWAFGVVQVEMVRAAEQMGHLDRILDHLNRDLWHVVERRRVTLASAIAPLLVLVGALLVLGGSFITTGIPALSRLVMGRYPSAWSALGDTVGFALAVSAGVLVVVAAYRSALRAWRPARDSYERLKLGNPVAGPFFIARFCRVLATAFATGMPLGTAIATAGQASGCHIVAERAGEAAALSTQGVSLSEALGQTMGFPAAFLQHVRTAEQTGNVDELLSAYARDVEDRALGWLHVVVMAATYLAAAVLATLTMRGILALH